MGQLVVHESGLLVRPGTGDIHIADEHVAGAWSDLRVEVGDVVLDVGANIGSAAAGFLSRGARVVAVEPDDMNVTVLRLNAPDAVVVVGAVASQSGMATFWRSGDGTPWRQSLDVVDGGVPVPVPLVSWGSLLGTVRPTVIKCDIEGGEYRLGWELVPASVHTIGLELHDVDTRADDVARLLAALVTSGFTVNESSTPASRPVDRVVRCTRTPM